MGVNMPERSDVFGLVATHLALHQARLGALDARGAPGTQAPALVETVGFQEPADRRVGGNRTELGSLLGERLQVHMVKRDAPAHVASVLGAQRLANRQTNRVLGANISADFASKYAHRIATLLSDSVEPALQRRYPEAHRQPGDRMPPLVRCESFELGAQLTLRWRSRQQLANHAEAHIGPALVVGSMIGFLHGTHSLPFGEGAP
jgi:hypothetical protein